MGARAVEFTERQQLLLVAAPWLWITTLFERVESVFFDVKYAIEPQWVFTTGADHVSTITFPPSPSTDVVEYLFFYEIIPTAVTENSLSVSLGLSTSVDLVQVLPDLDGIYNIGVAAKDDADNLSDLSILNNVSLDFIPPQPPGPITVS